MSPDIAFLLSLGLKMAVVAAFVVVASIVTERAGPVIGALVSTLPVSAGPAYVLLAIQHDAAFIADSTVTSLAVNTATGIFALAYAVVAQRSRLLVSVSVALGLWFGLAALLRQVPWTLGEAVLLNVLVYALCIPTAARFRHVKMPLVVRRWYDIPLRAAMVAVLVATLVAASDHVGPAVSGIIAIFPIVLSSLMLILQPRIGGPATAAVLANGMWGLVGFGFALLTLHFLVVPLGAALALGLSLAVSVGWNMAVWALRRRAHPARSAAAPSKTGRRPD
jgi:hypothetical protein